MARRKNPAAVALGRLGGRVGGKKRMDSMTAEERTEFASKGGTVGGRARAQKLTPAQRKKIAAKAAAARWAKKRSPDARE